MLTKTKKAMQSHALTLKPSTDRAQCYTIANYTLTSGESIADRLCRDHSSSDGALRAAAIMVDAGCATESNAKDHCFGTFHFEDGSSIN